MTRAVITGLACAVAAGAIAVAVIDPFRPAPSQAQGAIATGTGTVMREDLSSQTEVSGTLGYAGSYTVAITPSGGGVITALPAAGQVIAQGSQLFAIGGAPVVLLYGRVPAYRPLSQGVSGADVAELNADLIALGLAPSSAAGDYFGAATVTGVARLQARLGQPQTGDLPLGSAVFLPTAAKITKVTAALGVAAPPGAPVMQVSSITRQVTAQLDAIQQQDVVPGQQVSITLPSNQGITGVVTSVGTIASAAPGSSSPSTVTVDIRPAAVTEKLDQAPVQVTITTGTARDALVVPVDSLLAQPGGYQVELAGSHRLVPVTLGLFDDADGLVQVHGAVTPGQSVVVPRT